jgi:hypothetical protein
MRLIIASVPRAGSTYLLRSILNLGQGNNTPPEIFKRNKPFHYPVVKTHSKANDVLHNGYKAIFLYRNPMECVISTKFNRWDYNHFLNCGVDRQPKECDIYKEDVLDYEGIFDSWMKNNGYPVMTLKYDTLYKHFDDINKFIGKEINFLPWRDPLHHRNLLSIDDYNKLHTVYESFIKKYESHQELEYYD